MNSRFALRLKEVSKKHILLKIPCAMLFILTLPFIKLYEAVITGKRKFGFTAFIAGAFVLTSSFTFAGSGGGLNEGDEGNIYVTTDEGAFQVDYMNDFQDTAYYSEAKDDLGEEAVDNAVSMQEMEDALQGVTAEGSPNSETFYKADADAKVFDENRGYVEANYEDDWSLILINKDHRIPDNYSFDIAYVKGAIKSDVRVAPYLLDMIKAAKEEDVILYICSPYRDEEKQQELFDKKVASYVKKGFTEEEAYKRASQTVAAPGTSEHQVGLAFDFITEGYMMLNEGFEETEAGKWLKANAADYGFILRYPRGWESVTNIQYEPWHYRFVGIPAAKEIMGRNITLEEYVKEIGMYD